MIRKLLSSITGRKKKDVSHGREARRMQADTRGQMLEMAMEQLLSEGPETRFATVRFSHKGYEWVVAIEIAGKTEAKRA